MWFLPACICITCYRCNFSRNKSKNLSSFVSGKHRERRKFYRLVLESCSISLFSCGGLQKVWLYVLMHSFIGAFWNQLRKEGRRNVYEMQKLQALHQRQTKVCIVIILCLYVCVAFLCLSYWTSLVSCTRMSRICYEYCWDPIMKDY